MQQCKDLTELEESSDEHASSEDVEEVSLGGTLLAADGAHTNHGADNARHGNPERKRDADVAVLLEAEHGTGHDGAHEGGVQISTHTSHITDVVTDVIGCREKRNKQRN